MDEFSQNNFEGTGNETKQLFMILFGWIRSSSYFCFV